MLRSPSVGLNMPIQIFRPSWEPQPCSQSISTAIGALLGGGCVLTSGILMRRAMQRYTAYLAIIGPNEAMEIETIAKKVGVKRKQAEQDLQKMIEKGYFGDTAYINKELGYIFMSSRADEELARAREAAMQKTREASKKEAVKQNAEAYADSCKNP